MGKNNPDYQHFEGYYGQPHPTYGLTEVVLPYQYYNYPQPNWKLPFQCNIVFSRPIEID